MVEVEDEDDAKAPFKHNTVDPRYPPEKADSSKGAEPPPVTSDSSGNPHSVYNAHRLNVSDQLQEDSPNLERKFTLPFHDLPGPPAPLSRVRMPKARITKPGASAVGVSVLSTRGRLATTRNEEIDLRLDSCADITLISEELYLSLKNRPSLQQGYQMQVFQLTETGTHIKGFVRIPVFMEATDGTIIETEAEAYVVPNMTVPILLGEDYHLNYEIQVSRSVTDGSYLHFKGSPYSVPAVGVGRTNDFDRLRKGAHNVSSFVKAKTHKRAKMKRQRRKRQAMEDAHLVKAAQDYRIRPHESCRVQVVGHFEDERDWFVEKNMLSCGNDNVLLVPNVLISSKDPQIPVANPSSQPRFIRKGEVLATIADPAQYFDTPRDADQWREMSHKAEALAAIITATGEDNVEAEEYGPKTAAMPDPTVYPSSQMKDLLDVGSLPEHLRDEAWRMLSSHEKAFGFDGRLGQYPSRVHIRTADGQVPISVPMYGSSPAKRQVINEQIDKWFEQGVIEPSRSPWSAPVVIAYRHGKARFCVDYRKLNAATIPDEFPIPRQSEILASLSGAQVLSSLDALSGFTQLEMAEEDVEKTAFRTHRGLFQFRRLPFGLRNGPSIFQRIMQNILAPYLWIFCLVYIDDIVVYSKSYEDHIVHLDKVLGAIERSGITLSPTKCHMFYDSILLLGHKVSRLGLSTHLEKVSAITELRRPSKVSELQTFLGMIVYFSAFIPFYADICSPLFGLLKKGRKWEWKEEHERAFSEAKEALQKAPVLGHPIEGLPYRLYTDASDFAIGCALQQIQPLKVKDLHGTRLYERLRKAYETGEPVPKIPISLSSSLADDKAHQEWGATLDDTVVYVERVIGYWSRSFKPAETRYSATEREALAAKEGLVKFQPFIEGEKILLVTDHAALQWARTYENANRRLAAWGAVFSAYAPDLEIIHRPGRKHSNVDPLSRLPRVVPASTSPPRDESSSIQINVSDTADNYTPAHKMGMSIFSLSDCLEEPIHAFSTTHAMNVDRPLGGEDDTDVIPEDTKDSYEKASKPPGYIHTQMSDDIRQRWIQGYKDDPSFRSVWEDKRSEVGSWEPGFRFFKDLDGLLYFRDADYHPRLCVPKTLRLEILTEAHESPLETAHMGTEKLWHRLSPRFYWKRMKADVQHFCETCDICQKIKTSNFNRYGYLIPNPIPHRPYSSISMDFIVNLPMCGEFNAIFVVVDRLTKHANFIPTSTGINARDFARLFTRHIICKYGVPESIISDRDPRWTSDFWKGIAQEVKTKMLLSSSHHPQHDGQTEILNRLLETMLRAYVNAERNDWADWLHLLEFAYNSAAHSSTGTSPFSNLLGYQPRSTLDFIPKPSVFARSNDVDRSSGDYLARMAMHRDSARQAIALAQHDQAKSYNKGRRPAPSFRLGSKVLLNPHSLEWIESKGEGAKLAPRWIGPFEVTERVNPKVYRLRLPDKYPGSPIFNIEHLRAYREPAEEDRTQMPESNLRRDESREYEVESILGHKRTGKTNALKFLVRWTGYGPQFDEWLTARDLRNASDILRDYRKRNNL